MNRITLKLSVDVIQSDRQIVNALRAASPEGITHQGIFLCGKYHRDGRLRHVEAVAPSLKALPQALTGLSITHVEFSIPAPSGLRAKPGWYSGEPLGITAVCVVGAQGRKDTTERVIRASGYELAPAITLFNRVMAGNLEPSSSL